LVNDGVFDHTHQLDRIYRDLPIRTGVDTSQTLESNRVSDSRMSYTFYRIHDANLNYRSQCHFARLTLQISSQSRLSFDLWGFTVDRCKGTKAANAGSHSPKSQSGK